ncbi:MAG TPA: hypothetical protein VGF56_10145 [Rhizomicrobium sp.]
MRPIVLGLVMCLVCAASAADGPNLAALEQDGQLLDSEKLALAEYMAAPAFGMHVARTDREKVRRHFEFRELEQFFKDGLNGEAIAAYESLPAGDRSALLEDDYENFTATIDGEAVTFEGGGLRKAVYWKGKKPPGMSAEEFGLDLALAYYAVGDSDRARAIARPDALAQARAYLSCYAATTVDYGANCGGRDSGRFNRAGFLDLALIHIGDDPYSYIERYHGAGIVPLIWDGMDLLPHDALCRYLRETAPDYAFLETCGPSTGKPRGDLVDKTRDAGDHARLLRLAPQLQPRIAIFAEFFASPDPPASPSAPSKPFVPAPPHRYTEPYLPLEKHIVPKKYRGTVLAVATDAMPKLPGGFTPVRVARRGNRVAVISVSQAYEQTAAASRGGYWVHLSEDGGKNWEKPLYTGLVENYPYVVLENAKLPMIDGDSLDIAVDVQTEYPGYGAMGMVLMPENPLKNFYLKLPLAELRRDSDHDGLTDIAERHLLLDPHNPDSDGDGSLDGADPMPNVRQAAIVPPDQKVRWALLKQEAGDPIFVAGKPDDFAGIRPDRMLLVYDAAAVQRRKEWTPDFWVIGIGPVIFHRAHDRGYVTKGEYAGGSTYRVWRDGTDWKLLRIGGWAY